MFAGAVAWSATPGGFCEIHPQTTMVDIADHLGVERPTAEEHLRRAENKPVAALIGCV